MDRKTYLMAILAFAVFGMLFSGYLSYNELFPSASGGAVCAALSAKILGVPTCVYGFVMYVIIGVLAALALMSKK